MPIRSARLEIRQTIVAYTYISPRGLTKSQRAIDFLANELNYAPPLLSHASVADILTAKCR